MSSQRELYLLAASFRAAEGEETQGQILQQIESALFAAGLSASYRFCTTTGTYSQAGSSVDKETDTDTRRGSVRGSTATPFLAREVAGV